jgi:hypothetical protein
MKRFSAISVLLIISACIVFAQNSDTKKNIFKTLSRADSLSGASVKIHQDERIDRAVSEKGSGAKTTATANGYRVQVFSSNVQRTAKNEAFKIERELRESFPELGVYVNYTSPFWKVRVGDFKTLQEAQDLRYEIVKLFPALKSETYTVKDKINL